MHEFALGAISECDEPESPGNASIEHVPLESVLQWYLERAREVYAGVPRRVLRAEAIANGLSPTESKEDILERLARGRMQHEQGGDHISA